MCDTRGIPGISGYEPLSFSATHCRNRKLSSLLTCESEAKFTASMAPTPKTEKGKTIPSLNIGESTEKN